MSAIPKSHTNDWIDLMMSVPKKIAWVTGASSGIGEALVKELSKDGWHVAISARSEDKLKALASSHKNVSAFPLDVTKITDVRAVFAKIEKTLGPVTMAVLNAGTYFPDTAETFKAAQLKKQFEVNVFGTSNCIETLLEEFLPRNAGHIAIMGSVAGYRGLPRSLSYGSSKAALNNLAEAIAGECYNTDLKIQIINPGFVKTPLTDKNNFKMPMLMEVEDAAKALKKGLESNAFEITFPWLFTFLTKLFGRILPNRAYIALIGKIKPADVSETGR